MGKTRFLQFKIKRLTFCLNEVYEKYFALPSNFIELLTNNLTKITRDGLLLVPHVFHP